MHVAVGVGLVLLGLGTGIKGIRSTSNFWYGLLCITGVLLMGNGMVLLGLF